MQKPLFLILSLGALTLSPIPLHAQNPLDNILPQPGNMLSNPGNILKGQHQYGTSQPQYGTSQPQYETSRFEDTEREAYRDSASEYRSENDQELRRTEARLHGSERALQDEMSRRGIRD